MRVIAGSMKGRQLKAVSGKTTRPTTDKVKEAIFQIIGPFFEGGACLDLFAGSGSLGIEAISRGMDRAIFVDKSTKAIYTIKENLHTLGIKKDVEVFRTDAFRAIQAAGKRKLLFDLILLDPPYGKVDYLKLLGEIRKHTILNKHGIIYCEHDKKEMLPEEMEGLVILKKIDYSGTIAATIYEGI